MSEEIERYGVKFIAIVLYLPELMMRKTQFPHSICTCYYSMESSKLPYCQPLQSPFAKYNCWPGFTSMACFTFRLLVIRIPHQNTARDARKRVNIVAAVAAKYSNFLRGTKLPGDIFKGVQLRCAWMEKIQ